MSPQSTKAGGSAGGDRNSRGLLPRSRSTRFRALETRVCLLLLCGHILSAAVEAQPPCEPLPPPEEPIIDVFPAQAGDLREIVAGAASGTTVLLDDGFYDLSGGDAVDRLSFNTPAVVLRSASGDRDAVVLDGSYVTNEIISIHASGVIIADLTIQRAFDHPIHISGSPGAAISGDLIHNVRIVDPGQQAIKINAVGDGYGDYGVIECSFIELTEAGRAEVRDNCYTGGIDAHKAWGWVVLHLPWN